MKRISLGVGYEQFFETVQKAAHFYWSYGRSLGAGPGSHSWSHVERNLDGIAREWPLIMSRLEGDASWQEFLRPRYQKIGDKFLAVSQMAKGKGVSIAALDGELKPIFRAMATEAELCRFTYTLAGEFTDEAAARPRVAGFLYYHFRRGLALAAKHLKGTEHPLAAFALIGGLGIALGE